MPISNLEPKHLWKQFDKIRSIPRPSRHEEKIRDYFMAFASERNLEAQTDSAGNVAVKIPATPGHENAPTIILQGHMDMVCEKNNDVEFDFMTDPIELEIDGEWLKAKLQKLFICAKSKTNSHFFSFFINGVCEGFKTDYI